MVLSIDCNSHIVSGVVNSVGDCVNAQELTLSSRLLFITVYTVYNWWW